MFFSVWWSTSDRHQLRNLFDKQSAWMESVLYVWRSTRQCVWTKKWNTKWQKIIPDVESSWLKSATRNKTTINSISSTKWWAKRRSPNVASIPQWGARLRREKWWRRGQKPSVNGCQDSFVVKKIALKRQLRLPWLWMKPSVTTGSKWWVFF